MQYERDNSDNNDAGTITNNKLDHIPYESEQ